MLSVPWYWWVPPLAAGAALAVAFWRTRRRLRALEKSQLERHQQQRQLALINLVNELLLKDPDAEGFMASFCSTLREHFDFVLVSIYLLTPSRGLELLAHDGQGIPEDHTHLALDGHDLVESDGLIASCVKQREPIYAPDVHLMPGYLQGHPDVRSEYAIPLLAGGETIGALNLESKVPNGFDETLRNLLNRLANQGALAIQRARILDQLRESKHRYQIATAAGQVSLWDLNIETGDFFIGEVILKALGIPLDAPPRHVRDWRPYFPDDDFERIQAATTAYIKGQADSYVLEHRMHHQDGGFRWVMARAEALRRQDGGVLRLVGTVTDITEKKEYELALLEAKESAEAANAAKSDFLARMSHELRTPLHGVIGSASLLSSRHLDGDSTFLVDTIQLSARVLLSTINDILEVSKIEAGHVELEHESFSIVDCIDHSIRVVEGVANEKGLLLDYTLEDSVPRTLSGDFIRLRQILINLFHNAIKFTQEGSVRLDVERLDGDEISVYLRFAVTDTGPGISEAQQRRLFDPFMQGDTSATRRHDGTGLGLAICRHLVGLMGGTIWIESTLGEGSTFFFTILVDLADTDVNVVSQAPPEAIESTSTSWNRPLRVLVAEDNPVNQKVTEMQLRSLGCTSHIAKDGLATLDAYSRQSFDLILMDCQMPELSGFDTTQQIRSQEAGTHIPIIGLTAYATDVDRQRCLAAGMDDYLPKPITVEDLSKMLARWAPAVTQPALEDPDANTTNASEATDAVKLDETPLIDDETLDRLRQLSESCGEDVLGKAITLFARDAPRHLEALRSHYESADASGVTRSAHSLKGAAGALGALQLSALCSEIEAMGRQSEIPAGSEQIEAVQNVLQQTLERLRLESG